MQAFAQRTHNRDATGNRSLKEEVAIGSVGCGIQLGTDIGEEFLVGCDDRFTVCQCSQNQFTCRLDAADRLDDDVDVGVNDNAHGITG